MGGPKGSGSQTLNKLLGPKVGGPKFRCFFPSPVTISFLSSLSWVSSRGLLVVFEAPGPANARLEFLGFGVNPPVAPTEHTQNTHREHTENTERLLLVLQMPSEAATACSDLAQEWRSGSALVENLYHACDTVHGFFSELQAWWSRRHGNFAQRLREVADAQS